MNSNETTPPHSTPITRSSSATEHSKQSSPPGTLDPVVIVGTGCRLPGRVTNTSRLWDILSVGESTQSPLIPESRFHISHLDAVPGKGGYFIAEDVHEFENSFFGLSNAEVAYMDPQQRKLLECVYECFENAGYSLDSVSGADIGCYVANFTIDWSVRQTRDPDILGRYSATGMGTTILANRISHVFNLTGPTVVMDTACSSSLYALDAACVALDAEQCSSAIVAGANLITSPEQHIGTIKAGVISKTSTCHTFDASADGYGRAEGVGALLLKKLSTALVDGDKIRAVLLSTAVNGNGKTPGISHPDIFGQEAVIRKAYENAKPFGVTPESVEYVECHGTGTPVGDPIEVEALSRVFSSIKSPEEPLLVGSVKTSFGHSEACSGITSILKVIAAFEKDIIPPTIGIKNLNPNIPFDEWKIKVVQESRRWKPGSLKRVGVNSFGYGGANAHAILQAPDTYLCQTVGEDSVGRVLLPVSAQTEQSLNRWIDEMAQLSVKQRSLTDLAYTLSSRRSRLSVRSFIVTSPNTIAEDWKVENFKLAKPNLPLPVAFVFTGQGAQWPAMGRELIRNSTCFRQTVRRLDETLQNLAEHRPKWTLEAVLSGSEDIHNPQISQPTCTALQVGLVELLREWGVKPKSVIGHSSGEIAAAYAAGYITASQAITAAYFRGLAVSSPIVQQGAMIAVGLDVEKAQAIIEEALAKTDVGRAVVACVNSPSSVTISGDLSAIEAVEATIPTSTFCRRLKTSGRAYHSHQMKVVGDEYEAMLERHYGIAHEGNIRMASTAGGTLLPIGAPGYWRANLESPVLFEPGVGAMEKDGKMFAIEIGPHSALQLPLKQCRGADTYLGTLARGKDQVESLMSFAGNLYAAGYDIDLLAVNRSFGMCGGRLACDLPTYPWNYDSTVWTEPRASSEYRNRKHPRHELLGSQIPGGDGVEHRWRNTFRISEVPWVKDHMLSNDIVLPACGYLAMAAEALCQIADKPTAKTGVTFQNVDISSAITIQENIEVFTTIRSAKISVADRSSKWYEFDISSFQDGTGTSHCNGMICLDDAKIRTTSLGDYQLIYSPAEPWYEKMKSKGLNYGPWFQSIQSFETTTNARYVKGIVKAVHSEGYATHPITLDACLQAGITARAAGRVKEIKAIIPTFIESARVLPCEGRCISEAVSAPEGLSSTKMSSILREGGSTVVEFTNVKLMEYKGAAVTTTEVRHPCLEIMWKPDITRALLSNTPLQLGPVPGNIPSQAFSDIMSLLDSLVYKRADMKILQLGGHAKHASTLMEFLGGNTDFKKYRSYVVSDIEDGKIIAETDDPYDLILLPDDFTAGDYISTWLDAIEKALSDTGYIVAASSVQSFEILKGRGFTTTPYPEPKAYNLVVAARQRPLRESWTDEEVLILYDSESPLLTELTTLLKARGPVVALPFTDSTEIPPKAKVISLVELETSLLAVMDDKHRMQAVKNMLRDAGSLVWITSDSVHAHQKPEMGLAPGLARAIRLEQPAIMFATYDIDSRYKNTKTTAINIVDSLYAIVNVFSEFEYAQDGEGRVHVSRFVPNEELNERFRAKLGNGKVMTDISRIPPSRLDIEEPGMFDELFFRQVELGEIKPDEVEVEMKVIGLNAKDVYTMAGKFGTKGSTTSGEMAGVVRQVGGEVKGFAPGDRVTVLAPAHFQTVERFPQWSCIKLYDNETFEVAATLPTVYSTVIYSLFRRTNIQPSQRLLVHSAAGGVGIAAIELSRLHDIEVYATVSSEDKKEYLKNNYGIPTDHIFVRGSDFAERLLEATNNEGVDVILNSLPGDVLHDSWRLLAPFGHFIEIGKRDILNAGRLDMSIFARNTTFTAFDLADLYYDRSPRINKIFEGLIQETFQLYREGKIKGVKPLKVFDVGEIPTAFRSFSLRNRIGKVAVKLGGPAKILPPLHMSRFSPEKSYVMIGCLGGLGRSLSKWMMDQGARHFVFLARSGTSRPAARNLIDDITKAGGYPRVVTGDVSNREDVDATMQACETPIGGVIQAAMGLNESLFDSMPGEAWQIGMRPKVCGTWNLHNALEGRDSQLDFFLLTSSVSGSVGTATESNYCAANSFLDFFARYRQSLGKPATSVGLGMISEVGYLHENSEIEALLLRKGIQPLNEEEFLHIVDMALSKGNSHILTGLEPLGVRKLRAQGFDVSNQAMKDARSTILANALEENSPSGPGTQATKIDDPLELIRRRFSALILLPIEKLDNMKPIAHYGMDSMIAAEFRAWFWETFVMDISFLELLSKTATVGGLADKVVQTLAERK